MSGLNFTEACLRNQRKQKDLDKELLEIAKQRDSSLRHIHLKTLELLNEQDAFKSSLRRIENFDRKMDLRTLMDYNDVKDEKIKERRRAKMDKYSKLSSEPVDRMPIPKTYYVDQSGITELASCNAQLLRVKKWLLKCSDDFRWVHTTSGEHYQFKRITEAHDDEGYTGDWRRLRVSIGGVSEVYVISLWWILLLDSSSVLRMFTAGR